MEFNYITIKVKDLELSKTFYECLGVKLHAEKHGEGPTHYSAIMGSCVFEIYPWKGSEDTDFKTVRLGISVDNLQETVQRLIGLEIFKPLKKDVSLAGKQLELRDLDGRVIELIEK